MAFPTKDELTDLLEDVHEHLESEVDGSTYNTLEVWCSPYEESGWDAVAGKPVYSRDGVYERKASIIVPLEGFDKEALASEILRQLALPITQKQQQEQKTCTESPTE